MGLDALELVLATEEEFQIVISNEEAEKSTTPVIPPFLSEAKSGRISWSVPTFVLV